MILSNDLFEDFSEQNNPLTLIYLPWYWILVGLETHKGTPLMISRITHPNPQTSIADTF